MVRGICDDALHDIIPKLIRHELPGTGVELVEERSDTGRLENLKRHLQHTAAKRVARQFADVALERVENRRWRIQRDQALDDMVGIGRLDALNHMAHEFCHEPLALLWKNVLERLLDNLGVSDGKSEQCSEDRDETCRIVT